MNIEAYTRGAKDKPDRCLKVVILGDLGVGKTCLRSQFIYHIFTNAYKATIGGDYLTASVVIPTQEGPTGAQSTRGDTGNEEEHDSSEETLGGGGSRTETEKVNLQIWDTAGQERFNSISQAFYRGTDVVVLVYDITSYESVLSLRGWFKRFLEHCHVERPGVMIVGNKIDKAGERRVDKDEIQEILNKNTDVSFDSYVRNWDTDFVEVSCKHPDAVDELFHKIGQLGVELQGDFANKKDKHMVGFDSIDLQQGIHQTPSSLCLC